MPSVGEQRPLAPEFVVGAGKSKLPRFTRADPWAAESEVPLGNPGSGFPDPL